MELLIDGKCCKLKQCVVRTYGNGYSFKSNGDLEDKLKDGWTVAHVTTLATGNMALLEYVLEKYVEVKE